MRTESGRRDLLPHLCYEIKMLLTTDLLLLRENKTPRDPNRLAGAIVSLLDDPARARDMGRAGSLDVAARFTPERLADETLRAYEAAVQRFTA